MSAGPALTPRVIGQAEAAHRPALERILAGTGITFGEWVALTLAAGGTIDRRLLVAQLAEALNVAAATAEAAVSSLMARGILCDVPEVALTGAGRVRYRELRAAVDALTERVLGAIPSAEPETAGRVLTAITDRLNAELRDQA